MERFWQADLEHPSNICSLKMNPSSKNILRLVAATPVLCMHPDLSVYDLSNLVRQCGFDMCIDSEYK